MFVRFRVLNPPEVEMLSSERESMGKDAYMRLVLEAVIYNLSEITEALRVMPKDKAKDILTSLCNGAFMLNPGLDPEAWMHLAEKKTASVDAPAERPKPTKRKATPAPPTKKLSKERFVNLERYLKERVIGQDAAIDVVVNALKRSLAGLGDENRPLGTFLFAGASGVGKTLLARELHKHLFGDGEPVRVDCGEYQHKHETSKLLGAPPGYVGFDEGSAFANAVKKNPHTVVLLDEVEKAHPDLWHTFLRVFDEGFLTDATGTKIDFRETVIIMTTNLGNRQVVDEMLNRSLGFARIPAADLTPAHSRVERLAKEAIRKMFAPEFLNRVDKTVVFNHLTKDNLKSIAELELNNVDAKISKKGYSLEYDPASIDAMVADCDGVQGARRLAHLRRDEIEIQLADLLLTRRYTRGTVFSLSHDSSGYQITARRPKRSVKTTS